MLKSQIKIIDELLEKGKVLKRNYSLSLVKTLLENGVLDIDIVEKFRMNKKWSQLKKEVSEEQN